MTDGRDLSDLDRRSDRPRGALIVGVTVGSDSFRRRQLGLGSSAVPSGLLAAFSLVRNLLGLTPSASEESGSVKWWHKVVAFAVLSLAFMIKGLSAVGLSMRAAILNAGICIGILFAIGAWCWCTSAVTAFTDKSAAELPGANIGRSRARSPVPPTLGCR